MYHRHQATTRSRWMMSGKVNIAIITLQYVSNNGQYLAPTDM